MQAAFIGQSVKSATGQVNQLQQSFTPTFLMKRSGAT